MKQSLKTLLPALIVVIAGAVLIGCYYLRIPVLHNLGFMQGFQFNGNGKIEKLVTLMGDGAILLGAASFAWFIFKKKMKTSPKLIKYVGKKVYNLHAYFGWTALVLVVLHGGYYIMTDIHNRNILTGLAAFLILAVIAVYGYLVKRLKNKHIKKVHFMLTAAWLVALLIHGGGLVIASGAGLVGLVVLLSILKTEQKAVKTKKKVSAV